MADAMKARDTGHTGFFGVIGAALVSVLGGCVATDTGVVDRVVDDDRHTLGLKHRKRAM